MSWFNVMIFIAAILVNSCKNQNSTSSDKGNSSNLGTGSQITMIEVQFPFGRSYGNGVTFGLATAYGYVQNGSHSQNFDSTFGTVEYLLGSATDRASAIAKVKSLLLSSEGWFAPRSIPVCYKTDLTSPVHQCIDSQNYDKAVIIGARIEGKNGSNKWSCIIGFYDGETCTNDNENIKQQIRSLRDALIGATYRKDGSSR